MSIFTTKRQKYIREMKTSKDLTAGKRVVSFNPEEVYIPLVDPVTAKPLTLNVKVGDEVKVGTVIGTRVESSIPVFSTVSGIVESEALLLHAALGRNVKHFVIKNDQKYDKEPNLPALGEDATKEELVERLKEAGILGYGGAGFPTYLKYQAENIDTIIVNGVECETHLTDDYNILLTHKDEIVAGLKCLMKAAGATRAFIAFKKSYKNAVKLYKDVAKENENIKVVTVSDSYPSGWERQLIKAVTKRTYTSLPLEAGVIVNNVETVLYSGRAILNGEVATRKIMTVSGEGIKNPAKVELPIYTRAIDVINYFGGYTAESVSVSFGGAMTSRGVMDDKAVILPFTRGLTILPRIKLNTVTCLNCGTCTLHCPTDLQPVEIMKAQIAKNTDRIMDFEPWHCIGCSLCSYVCPSKIDVSDYVKKAKLVANIQLKKLEMQKKAKEGK